MATFLTNRKMSPALRARIEASVSGRKSTGPSPAFVRALARIGFVLVVVVVVVWMATRKREGVQILERERGTLLDLFRVANATISDEDRRAIARDESFITRLAGPYEGDFISDEISAASGMKAALALPFVYLHGSIDALANSASIERAAAGSVQDPLVACLVDPPRSRSEAHVAAKVRAAGTDIPQSRRLLEAYRGLRILDPSWEQRARGAKSLRDVTTMRTELERAPLDKARQALRAALLVIVVDEAADDPASVPELDGERAHHVRVELVDVALGNPKVLLRMRKHVDPSAWSPAARADYASGYDGCALAFDLRDAVSQEAQKRHAGTPPVAR